MRRFGRRNGIRFFAPPALVVLVVIAVLVGLLQMTGVLTGPLSLVISAVVYLPLLAYLLLVIAVACLPGGGGPRQRLWTLLVLPTMHLSWGLGFLGGVLRGARDTVDASRLGTRNTPLP